MQKIIPHLWFNTNAEEAATFYTTLFRNGSISPITRYTETGYEIHKMKAGIAMTVPFHIENLDFIALNGGPIFTFTPAISFMIHCPSKEEVDELWNGLSQGGTALMPLDAYPFSERYGWIQDRFGVSWQIIFNGKVTERSIVPTLLFVGDKLGQAEEAMKLYTSLFPDASIGALDRYGADQAPNKEGSIMYGEFTLAGQKFSAMDGGGEHAFTFNEAISLLVTCKDQSEIDHFWNALSAVPESEQCGWLKDRFGVSWQIVPEGMGEVLNSPDKEKAKRGMEAMLQMKKIDIAKLREAIEE